MNTPSLNIDLHCHSTVSDGVLAPAAVAERARANGVDIWALTDHDELSGIAEAARAAKQVGLRHITGVEISCTWASATVHIVGLNFDPENVAMVEGLHKTRSGRGSRAQEIGRRLAAMGMPGAYEGALEFVANPELISRSHFARWLVKAGYERDVQAVFTKHLGDDRAGHVPVQWATLTECIGWILGAGGVAVMAHPGRYKYSPMQFDALFDEFEGLGGRGVEVITGSHTPDEAKHYARVAKQRGLLASRGSDFHSPQESRIDLGRLPQLPSDLTPVWHDWF